MEYEALLTVLRSAKVLKVKKLRNHYDSQLVVNQLSGEYEAWDEKMAAYVEAAQNLLGAECTRELVGLFGLGSAN